MSTELHFVVVPASLFAAFEIDGVRDMKGSAIGVAAELDKIRLAGHTEPIRHQHHPGDIPLVASFEVRGLVDFFVSVDTFGRVLIVLPDLLDKRPRQSAFTEQRVVEISKRQKIVVVILQRIGQSKSSVWKDLTPGVRDILVPVAWATGIVCLADFRTFRSLCVAVN